MRSAYLVILKTTGTFSAADYSAAAQEIVSAFEVCFNDWETVHLLTKKREIGDCDISITVSQASKHPLSEVMARAAVVFDDETHTPLDKTLLVKALRTTLRLPFTLTKQALASGEPSELTAGTPNTTEPS